MLQSEVCSLRQLSTKTSLERCVIFACHTGRFFDLIDLRVSCSHCLAARWHTMRGLRFSPQPCLCQTLFYSGRTSMIVILLRSGFHHKGVHMFIFHIILFVRVHSVHGLIKWCVYIAYTKTWSPLKYFWLWYLEKSMPFPFQLLNSKTLWTRSLCACVCVHGEQSSAADWSCTWCRWKSQSHWTPHRFWRAFLDGHAVSKITAFTPQRRQNASATN